MKQVKNHYLEEFPIRLEVGGSSQVLSVSQTETYGRFSYYLQTLEDCDDSRKMTIEIVVGNDDVCRYPVPDLSQYRYIGTLQEKEGVKVFFWRICEGVEEERAWGLLEEELGAKQFNRLMIVGSVEIKGNNGKIYTISRDGTIKREDVVTGGIDAGNIELKGRYPTGDVLVTLIKWIKNDAYALDRTWGCGHLTV